MGVHRQRGLVVIVVGMLAATCSSSHEPAEDPRPECPAEDDLVEGNACTLEDQECEAPTCGRLGGICVEYTWTCGRCDFCFFETIQHVENSFLPCNLDTGLCEEAAEP